MKKELNEEIWAPVLNYEGLYEASDLGRIRSLNYMKTGKTKVLKPGISRGYFNVTLSKNGKSKQYNIHRLVFSSFNGPIPPDMVVDHVNGDKRDNRLSNLQLLTSGDNTRKSIKGKKLSPEHRAKLKGKTPWNLGKPFSKEVRAKISSANKGQIPWNKGVPWPEETRAKMSASHKAKHQQKRQGNK